MVQKYYKVGVVVEKINLCTNETILEMLKIYKDRLKKAERITVIAMTMMLIQTMILVGGVLYFFSAYAVEVTDEIITEQTVEGENASINNVSGENNTTTNTFTNGGVE